ncbi:MAG: hypothetical protein R3293_26720, partial [Candidatus Promineifilaceae bacterium]|nr:hypothetical protein [Candidatus Promineifilaceae bacterium]
MAWAAIAENDRLQQRRPAQAVDVVYVDIRLQQSGDDFHVAAVGSADQAGAVVAVQAVHIRPGIQRQLQQLQVAIRGADQISALLRVVLAVDIRPRCD